MKKENNDETMKRYKMFLIAPIVVAWGYALLRTEAIALLLGATIAMCVIGAFFSGFDKGRKMKR